LEGYLQEAQYTEVVHNWHQAVDERGLRERQFSSYMYNNALLNFMLDDLMPWQTTTYDFSLLEVSQ